MIENTHIRTLVRMKAEEFGKYNGKYAGPGVGHFLYVFRDALGRVVGIGRKGRNSEGIGRYLYHKINGGHRMKQGYAAVVHEVLIFEMCCSMAGGRKDQAGLVPRADWLESSLIDDPDFRDTIISEVANRVAYDPSEIDLNTLKTVKSLM